MPAKMRAKQFAMFDAMKGLTEAIAEKERQIYPKRELASDRIDELNQILSELNPGDDVTVEYYCPNQQRYVTHSGLVKKVDVFWKELQLNDCIITFDEISNITAR